MTFYILATS